MRANVLDTWKALRRFPSVPPGRGYGALSAATRWSGDVRIRGDVVVPAGAVLEIQAGTRVYLSKTAAWKFEYQRPGDRGQWFGSAPDLCELIVFGVLRITGDSAAPVVFLSEGKLWGGIVLLGKSNAALESVRIGRSHRAAVSAFDRAEASLRSVQVVQSSVGVAAGGLSRVSLTESLLSGNERGLLAFDFSTVRADRVTFLKNGWGARADDAARLELDGCAFRFGRAGGLLAQGRARVDGNDNGFEGHPETAVSLQDNARGFFRNSRVFHNGAGYTVADNGRVFSEDDKIGPNRREGVSVLGEGRADLRRGFFHSHAEDAAVKSHQNGRVRADDCKFFGNAVGGSAQGRSAWRVRRCVFQGNAESGLRFIGLSEGRVESCRFERNRSGLAIMESAWVRADANRFGEQTERAVHALGDGSGIFSKNVFKDNGTGGEAQDRARLESRRDRWFGQRGHGLLARQEARLSVSSGVFEENAQSGVQGLDRAALEVNGCRFLANGVGVGASGAASVRVTGTIFQSNRRQGFVSSGEGIVAVTGNTFVENSVASAHLGRDRSLVRKNRFWGLEQSAGVCADEAAPMWERNRLLGNRQGIECRDRSRPTLVKNRFERTREAAVRCEDESLARLRNNVFRLNGADCLARAPARLDLAGNRFAGLGTRAAEAPEK